MKKIYKKLLIAAVIIIIIVFIIIIIVVMNFFKNQDISSFNLESGKNKITTSKERIQALIENHIPVEITPEEQERIDALKQMHRESRKQIDTTSKEYIEEQKKVQERIDALKAMHEQTIIE